MKVTIWSHHDADGIISAYLISKFHSKDEVSLNFQKWYSFGIQPTDLTQSTDLIYILDLGCSIKTLETLQKFAFQNPRITTILIDHHLPQSQLLDYTSPNFLIVHDTNNCTTGLVYHYLKSKGYQLTPIQEQLVMIGIFADVAQDTPQGAKILQELGQKYPELLWNYTYWTGKYESTIPTAGIYSRYFNTPKRVAFEKGASIAIKALEEIEKAQSFSVLDDSLSWVTQGTAPPITDRTMDAEYPNITILNYWLAYWTQHRSEALDSSHCKTLDFPNFSFSIVNFPLAVASYIAMVKSTQKPNITINTGLPYDYFEISGRAKEESGFDLNAIAQLVNQELGTEIGGHKTAIGGAIPKTVPLKSIITSFWKVFTGASETALIETLKKFGLEVSSE